MAFPGNHAQTTNALGGVFLLCILSACTNSTPPEVNWLPSEEDLATHDRHVAALQLQQDRWYFLSQPEGFSVPVTMLGAVVLESYPLKVPVYVPSCDCERAVMADRLRTVQSVLQADGQFALQSAQQWQPIHALAFAGHEWLAREVEQSSWSIVEPANIRWMPLELDPGLEQAQ